MKSWLLVTTFLGSSALAQEEEAQYVETVTLGQHTPLLLEDDWINPLDQVQTVAEFRDLEFEPEAYRGAEQLGLSPVYIHEVRAGLEKIYERDYPGARDHFEAVEERFPGTAIEAVTQVVMWQAMMLENFDFLKNVSRI
jgi:hypothetical protein